MIATVLKAYANKEGEDENLWYITGLLHDKELEWFKEWGYPEELIHACL